jgi:hypothetical protein
MSRPENRWLLPGIVSRPCRASSVAVVKVVERSSGLVVRLRLLVPVRMALWILERSARLWPRQLGFIAEIGNLPREVPRLDERDLTNARPPPAFFVSSQARADRAGLRPAPSRMESRSRYAPPVSDNRASLLTLGAAAFLVSADARVIDPLLKIISTEFSVAPETAALVSTGRAYGFRKSRHTRVLPLRR